MNKKERRDKKHAFLIVAIGLLFITFLVYPILSQDNSIRNYKIILIDCSDNFTKRHLHSIKNDVNSTKEEISHNNDIRRKVSLFTIEGDAPTVPSPVVSILIDGKGYMSNKRWQTKNLPLLENLYSSIDKVLSHSDESSQTPIFEYLKHISKVFKDSNAENCELIIYSDFVQNIDHKWSKNQGKLPFKEYKKTKYYKDTKIDLKNIIIKMRYIEREKYRKIQTDEHREFWESYFQDAGVNHIDFLSIY